MLARSTRPIWQHPLTWLLVLAALLFVLPAFAQSSEEAQQIKEFLSRPLVLLGLMVAAAAASAFKQMSVARRSGGVISVTAYFKDNWPETVIMIGQGVALFLTLVMTDSLNFASALGAGYVANDLADVWTAKGRSAAMNPQ